MSGTCLKLENITTNIKIYKLHSFENERFFKEAGLIMALIGEVLQQCIHVNINLTQASA